MLSEGSACHQIRLLWRKCEKSPETWWLEIWPWLFLHPTGWLSIHPSTYKPQPGWGAPNRNINVFCPASSTSPQKHTSPLVISRRIFCTELGMTSSKGDFMSVTRVTAIPVCPGIVFIVLCTQCCLMYIGGWGSLYFTIFWHECLAWMNRNRDFLIWWFIIRIIIVRIDLKMVFIFRHILFYFTVVIKDVLQSLQSFSLCCSFCQILYVL